ncbi:MAG: SNF2-related protein [bacterium]|nr:SNF2-related protein [bacterium]
MDKNLAKTIADEKGSVGWWGENIVERLRDKDLQPLEVAHNALQEHPTEWNLLVCALFAAIVEERPEICLHYVKRLKKNYSPSEIVYMCEMIALAQQGSWPLAQSLLKKHGFHLLCFPTTINSEWLKSWVIKIQRWQPSIKSKKSLHKLKPIPKKPQFSAADIKKLLTDQVSEDDIEPLPRFPVQIPITFNISDETRFSILEQTIGDTIENFRLRLDFVHLSLLKGFDDLLCLSHLNDVNHYWYQIETTRKVLKQFRGRVLLADEVGIGKTIEAGMVLKEYILRGMVKRFIILTPPSLVRQWEEELETKFGINTITSHDPLLRKDPSFFWTQPRIIASIDTAKHTTNFDLVIKQDVDLVIVDEAHHLKNRNTRNWKLVDALKKRFLLLLSATPVQNNLIELYNLLTLLKPGIFKTEKEFRTGYMVAGKPRIPANRERLQNLMRDVMIRNTRSLVDVRLPSRHAITLRIDPSPEEKECYLMLGCLIKEVYTKEADKHRLALHHLLEAAGSTPSAVSLSLRRFLEHTPSNKGQELCLRYAKLHPSTKIQTLFDLLDRNPSEKKIVFVRFRETINLLDTMLRERGVSFARFDGQMTGLEKDAAIERFRTESQVLLCTETGGEGRNIQFCNTIINFDLPWNPQAIEQRIGRIHRIGQEREVFIFNLAVRGTVEDEILRILDEKINMFELVVGEVQSIMGEIEDNAEFSNMVFSTWVEANENNLKNVFDQLGDKILKAKEQYEAAKTLDNNLFGEEFDVA